MTDKEAMQMALEALEANDKLINGEGDRFGLEGAMDGYYSGCFDVEGVNKKTEEAITALRQALEQPADGPMRVDGNTSDGYHTFNELYEFRKAYNAAFFNELAAGGKCSVHKSWRHHDGELCFGGGWFIVVAILPDGQISNHYKAEDWDLFALPETEKALFQFDGHTGADVLNRLKAYRPQPADEPVAWRTCVEGIWFTAGKKATLQKELESINSEAEIEPLYTGIQPDDKPVEWVIPELYPVMKNRLSPRIRARRKT